MMCTQAPSLQKKLPRKVVLVELLLLRLPGNCRGGCFVLIPTTDLVFYALGSGEYDEMACKHGAVGASAADLQLGATQAAACRVLMSAVPFGTQCM